MGMYDSTEFLNTALGHQQVNYVTCARSTFILDMTAIHIPGNAFFQGFQCSWKYDDHSS